MRAVLVLLCCVASEVCTSKWPSPAWVFLPCCFCSLVPLLPPPLLLQELNHRGMPTRGYVLIFVFWALLTIITPTLVSWSASAKPNLVAPGIQFSSLSFLFSKETKRKPKRWI
ncbi:hypothetical protein MUK42_14876 [Musa troglodytarum]|uniref:Uncharacterized protein n=1 Tax=Musa troglodytarum TaxID=320322 RepID=A0A9E7I2U1_9LILI|nr:hypothetical protein MUK42_14876 [Musa troglodytarum]URE44401.1 hypothetical protein MUK42_14876 [Musa troglodytarum]